MLNYRTEGQRIGIEFLDYFSKEIPPLSEIKENLSDIPYVERRYKNGLEFYDPQTKKRIEDLNNQHFQKDYSNSSERIILNSLIDYQMEWCIEFPIKDYYIHHCESKDEMEKILNDPEFDLDETDWRGNFFPSYYVGDPKPICNMSWVKSMKLKIDSVRSHLEKDNPDLLRLILGGEGDGT